MDQRIEQVFGVMNQILKASEDDIQGRFLRTYQVQPITHDVGIIEWVPSEFLVVVCVPS